MQRCLFVSIFSLVFFLSANSLVFAQLGVEPTIGIKVSPEIPGPNEDVTITVTSFSTDIKRALVSWFVDGEVVLSGYGEESVSIKSPVAGSQKSVSLKIVTETGVEIEKNIVIAPQDVDLLWEAIDSYAPPFYKGRSLPSREALVKVSAIPSIRNSAGAKISNSDLVYNWSQNYSNKPNFSGYGKSYFVYKNAYLDDQDFVSLTVSSRDGRQTAKKDLRLSLGSPKIIFYTKDPSTSIVSSVSVDSLYTLTDDSKTIVAIPYFFSTQNKGADLSYVWKINNQTQVSPTTKNELTIRKPEGISGESFVSLGISNDKTLYQSKESSFEVKY